MGELYNCAAINDMLPLVPKELKQELKHQVFFKLLQKDLSEIKDVKKYAIRCMYNEYIEHKKQSSITNKKVNEYTSTLSYIVEDGSETHINLKRLTELERNILTEYFELKSLRKMAELTGVDYVSLHQLIGQIKKKIKNGKERFISEIVY
jgi:DNA-directed RNA polymerase specialized sigma24 family protein